MSLTQQRLKELVSYDPLTGIFTRLVTTSSQAHKGDIAGYFDKTSGYMRVMVDKRRYLQHRLVWLYVHGEWPAVWLDHWDTDKTNNRLANLRPCIRSENAQNASLRTDNSSGFKGVSWLAKLNKWVAYVNVDGKRQHIGCFISAEDAAKAVSERRLVLHKDFTNHG